jgi:hypothetical protein
MTGPARLFWLQKMLANEIVESDVILSDPSPAEPSRAEPSRAQPGSGSWLSGQCGLPCSGGGPPITANRMLEAR